MILIITPSWKWWPRNIGSGWTLVPRRKTFIAHQKVTQEGQGAKWHRSPRPYHLPSLPYHPPVSIPHAPLSSPPFAPPRTWRCFSASFSYYAWVPWFKVKGWTLTISRVLGTTSTKKEFAPTMLDSTPAGRQSQCVIISRFDTVSCPRFMSPCLVMSCYRCRGRGGARALPAVGLKNFLRKRKSEKKNTSPLSL